MCTSDDACMVTPPLVLVEGFMCAASDTIWGDFRGELEEGDEDWLRLKRETLGPIQDTFCCSHSNQRGHRRTIFVPIGPVSSLHDRACELFYSLRGGRVDYGEDHSRTHGHGQFGRDMGPGRYQLWGEVDPASGRVHTAHFMGHSMGGPTLYKLQQLLRIGFFDHALASGEPNAMPGTDLRSRTNAMVLSILAVSSPFRGTPIVHLLGEEPMSHPVVRKFSAGDLIAKAAHLITFLKSSWVPGIIKNRLPDLLADSWPFAASTQPSQMLQFIRDIPAVLGQLIKSDWAEGRDCAPWDCTIYERTRVESDRSWGADSAPSSSMHRGTWFCSIAAYMTEEGASGVHSAHWLLRESVLASLMAFSANWIGRFRYDTIPDMPKSALSPTEALDRQTKQALVTEVQSVKVDSGYASSECCAESKNASEVCSTAHTPLNSVASERVCRDSVTSRIIEGATANLRHHSGLHCTAEDNAGQTASQTLLPHYGPAAWSANDGIVPLASQFHPRDCEEGLCTHSIGLPRTHMNSTVGSLRNGAQGSMASEHRRSHAVPNHYYTYVLPNTTHATLCPLWIGSEEQRQFWRFVAGWLRDVELASGVMC